ncbi:hypothetical protein E4U40_002187 [Claviceps sp. LM458 group G5]|nr:hypothetical protein E4U40_002187 [Claviceps sp. LM458 group G5]
MGPDRQISDVHLQKSGIKVKNRSGLAAAGHSSTSGGRAQQQQQQQQQPCQSNPDGRTAPGMNRHAMRKTDNNNKYNNKKEASRGASR